MWTHRSVLECDVLSVMLFFVVFFFLYVVCITLSRTCRNDDVVVVDPPGPGGDFPYSILNSGVLQFGSLLLPLPKNNGVTRSSMYMCQSSCLVAH